MSPLTIDTTEKHQLIYLDYKCQQILNVKLENEIAMENSAWVLMTN